MNHPFDENPFDDVEPSPGPKAKAKAKAKSRSGARSALAFAGFAAPVKMDSSVAILPGDRAVGRVAGLVGFDFILAAKKRALLAPSFGAKLAQAAMDEPGRMLDFANLLRRLSPKVGAGELWSQNVLRQLSGVCMCLGRAGLARAEGRAYRPEWKAVDNIWNGALAARTFEAAVADGREDIEAVGKLSAKSSVRMTAFSSIPLGDEAGIEDWMEWRGFQKLASLGGGPGLESGAASVLQWGSSYAVDGGLLGGYEEYHSGGYGHFERHERHQTFKAEDSERLDVVFETLALRREAGLAPVETAGARLPRL